MQLKFKLSKKATKMTLKAKRKTVPSKGQLKFGFLENATKFEKSFVVLLTRALCSVRATAYLSKSQ